MMTLHPDLVKEPRPHPDEPPTSDPLSFYAPYWAVFHGAGQKINRYADRYLDITVAGQGYIKTEHAR